MSGAALLVQIALRIAGLALVAVGGGNALVPALHEQTVSATHWLSEAGFAEAVGLSQIAPGPNMLLMPLIGWQIAGPAGAGVALGAFLVPSSAVAIVGARLIARYAQTRVVGAFRWALRPVTGGLMVAAASVLIQTAAQAWPLGGGSAALAGASLVLALAVAGAALRFKVNALVWLGLAALFGALV